MASIMVRSPGLAPPEAIILARPADRELCQLAPPDADWIAAEKKMASNTPDDPPMERESASLVAAKKRSSLASGIKGSAVCR